MNADDPMRDPGFVPLLPVGTNLDDPLSLYVDADRPPHHDRPWVLANFVAGLDGSVALQGRVGALTSRTDQVVFRLLRELADVVLVGAGTIRAGRYGRLVVGQAARRRRADRGQSPEPPLAIVTRSLDLPRELFTVPGPRPVVVTVDQADADARRRVAEVADVIVARKPGSQPDDLLSDHSRARIA